MNEAVAAALAMAEAQLARVESGDIDGYLAGLNEYGAACHGLEATVSQADRDALERLIAMDNAMNLRLQEAKETAGRKLATLAQGRAVSTAYLAQSTPRKRVPLLEG